MEVQFKKFNEIWLNYSDISIPTPQDFNKYILIIYQIRKNNFDFTEYKNDFINLIEILSTTILCYKYNTMAKKSWRVFNIYKFHRHIRYLFFKLKFNIYI